MIRRLTRRPATPSPGSTPHPPSMAHDLMGGLLGDAPKTSSPRSFSGFRSATVSRSRLLVGCAFIACAVAANFVVYASSTTTTAVVQLVRDVPAGAQLSIDDVRIVEIGAVDPSINVVGPENLTSMVGEFAVGRITAGTLLVRSATQPDPIVNLGHAVVSVDIPSARVPHGLRERSRVELVLAPDDRASVVMSDEDDAPPTVILPAIVTAPPRPVSSVGDAVAISFEVLADDAHLVVTHRDPGIVLLPDVPEGEQSS